MGKSKSEQDSTSHEKLTPNIHLRCAMFSNDYTSYSPRWLQQMKNRKSRENDKRMSTKTPIIVLLRYI